MEAFEAHLRTLPPAALTELACGREDQLVDVPQHRRSPWQERGGHPRTVLAHPTGLGELLRMA